MGVNILFFLSIILLTSFADSAEIVCEWSGDICTVSSITPVTFPNEAITIAGKPANYINTATDYFWFTKPISNLNYVPTRLFLIFPYVTRFIMSSSSAKTTLMTNSFVNCNYLTALQLSDLNITNVPEGFAQSCTNITSLQLVNAGIDTIDKNAFRGLINVKTLFLKENRLTCLPLDLFQTIPNVSILDLRSNRISAIDSGLFRNLLKLSYIQMSNNSMSYLPTLEFTGSAQSPSFSLYLAGNPIYAIKLDICNMFNSRPGSKVDIPQTKCIVSDASIVMGLVADELYVSDAM